MRNRIENWWAQIRQLHARPAPRPRQLQLLGLLAAVLLLNGCGSSVLEEATPAKEFHEIAAESFDIETIYPSGSLGEREKQAFATAVGRWSQVVVGGLPDTRVRADHVEQSCGAGYRFEGIIDDLLLIADVRELDGSGGIVGMAGACLLRSDGFPLVGLVVLDRADIDRLAGGNDLENAILHELGHVLELNMSGWQRRDLLDFDDGECVDSQTVEFKGERASQEFNRAGGSGSVPVEDNGVAGTACSHWDEETFQSELMTGYLDDNVQLSTITAAALEDMGYRVDMAQVDNYQVPGAGVVPLSSGMLITEKLLPPGGVVNEHGEFEPLDVGDR